MMKKKSVHKKKTNHIVDLYKNKKMYEPYTRKTNLVEF